MQPLKTAHILQLLFLANILFQESVSESDDVTFCGSIRIQEPFLHQNLYRHMILCKSENLYFRSSIGLFKISSINYVQKLLTLSLNSCSSSSVYVSPNHLSAGFPSLSSPNSLVLVNCSNLKSGPNMLSVPCNGRQLKTCHAKQDHLGRGLSYCALISDVGLLENGFHPQVMNCTHYGIVHKRDDEVLESGMKISFDIDNPCDQCRKPGGACGAGLRCICHPKQCKDKVISVGALLKKPNGNMFYCLVLVVIISGIFG